MKKILLLCAAATAMITASAQQVLLEEEFDNGTIPETWLNVDADGDGYKWAAIDSLLVGHKGNDGCAYSQSFVNNVGAKHPDNWLITPQITLSGNCTLTYFVAGQDKNYAAEHYGVFLSETGTQTTDFTETLIDETLPNGTNEYHEKTIDLSAYAGKAVYLAFRHYNISDMYMLKLDGVKVESSEQPSAVSDIAVAEPESNVWYDLQGRKFEQKPEVAGIYISNGKKVVVR